MSNLSATAHTPVGVFKGNVSHNDDSSTESLVNTRDTLETSIDTLNFLVLYSKDGKEICLPGNLVKNSVIIFELVE